MALPEWFWGNISCLNDNIYNSTVKSDLSQSAGRFVDANFYNSPKVIQHIFMCVQHALLLIYEL